MLKPFRPPSFVRKIDGEKQKTDGEPPLKRRRTDEGTDPLAGSTAVRQELRQEPRHSLVSKSDKVPSLTVPNVSNQAMSSTASDECFYNVMWRKPTAKKHKTWDSDGILRIAGRFAHLQDISGKELGRSPNSGAPLLPGSNLKIGGRDVEVESILSHKDYLAGRPFLRGTSIAQPVVIDEDEVQCERMSSSQTISSSKFIAPRAIPISTSRTAQFRKPRTLAANRSTPFERDDGAVEKPLHVVATQSLASRGKWKNPVKNNTVLQKTTSIEPTPRHDAKTPNAVVMQRPALKDVPQGKQIVDVVIDPLLSNKLRDHQREGVKFLYNCVMGFQTQLGHGAILADEMGLGKTLQTIALIWTLLKQNPIYGADPVIRKALIVCPVTLIKNWRKEFRKWLGPERIGVFVAEDKKTRITDFTKGRSYSVMIIGYERLRSVHEELQKGHGIDLVVADEGHRLKTAQSKSAQAIQSLATPKRIILSGTPIQNDLGEFFSMVDFVNPGALGQAKSFARTFEKPIERSRQPDATEKEIEKGNARGEELADTTNVFILRRTADILAKYLPPKTESILMCKPTAAQVRVYKHVLASPVFQSALGSSENALQLITILKKVCNSPQLLSADPGKDPEKLSLAADIAASIPTNLLRNASASAKLRVLDDLLSTIRKTTSEKVVVVSNFTSTLDVLGQLLTSQSMPFLRLDGSTPTSKRQDLVDTFNRTDSSRNFAFLLSAKSGGMGLNLIGASRLVLFDVDWNPAIDAQAMARIHRDGQKRHCYIYRLLLGGALDEKIWQRQVTKLGLADSVLQSKSGQASFSRDELKDLFRLDECARCQTHELIRCPCQRSGGTMDTASTAMLETDDCVIGENGSLVEISSDEEAHGGESEEDQNIIASVKRKRRDGNNVDDSQDDKPFLHFGDDEDVNYRVVDASREYKDVISNAISCRKRSRAEIPDGPDHVSLFDSDEVDDIKPMPKRGWKKTDTKPRRTCDNTPAFDSEEDEFQPSAEELRERTSTGATSVIDEAPRLLKSSILDIDLQERIIQERREAARNGKLDAGKEMVSLMKYDHIDTLALRDGAGRASAADAIADDVLNEVVRDEDNLITFVFTKTTS